MNAINFIKENGVEKAREVVDGAPDKTATHYVFRKIPNYYSVDFQSWYHDGEWWDSDCQTEQDLIDSYGLDFVVNLSELKHLLEKSDSEISINFFKEWGLEHSRNYVAVAEDDGDILQWEKDLKRLVESVDLIDSLGGLELSKKESNDCRFYEYADMSHRAYAIKQAIADYESIYGGEHV